MSTDPVSSTITTATSGLQGELVTVAGLALAVAVVVFAISFGWRWVKSLIS